MKKILYFVLLAVELFAGFLFMSGLWNSSLYIPVAVTVALVVGLLVWQLMRFAKAADCAAKKKILRNIALILLIPSAVFVITYIGVVIALIIEFA